MAFLELTVVCHESDHARYARALEDVGALAVTWLDADAQTAAERPILEPGVGETPLWNRLTLTALFPETLDALVLLAALDAFDPSLDWKGAAFRRVDDQDWERVWLDQFQPMQFGLRTWVVPWNHELPPEAQSNDTAVVRLDPGLAFGSGTHPTTALCLRWLDALAQDATIQGASILDFGCGSGILALAALKLGAAHAVAVDNDPQALLATQDNAKRNGVATCLRVHSPDTAPTAHYPIVVANILASALEQLAEVLAERTAPGGRLALSGILVGQESTLLERYTPWFECLRVVTDGDWLRIDGVRR